MQTLIIHPDDRSTDFLKPIYKHVDNPTIVTGGVTRGELSEMIEEHDVIMMMGHGTTHGLMSCGKFGSNDYSGYVIDWTTVPLLLDKVNIAIWCNADVFMNKYELPGLYTGMFISEVGEAHYCGLPNIPQYVVDESNVIFSDILGKLITKNDLKAVYNCLKIEYSILAESNEVAAYNNKRLYERTN